MNQQGFDASGGAGSLSKLFAHYDRTKLLNPETGEYEYQRYPSLTVRGTKRSVDYSDIDPERTHLNYNLAEDDQSRPQAEFLAERLASIHVHKSALKNALVDWVVTLPDMEQYAGREREFFETVYKELRGKYGRENVVSAYVHMDEKQPHMHFAFVPVARDEKHPEGWKLSRKAVNTCDRVVENEKTGERVVKRDTYEFSKQAHEQVEKRVCEVMGFEKAGVILTDEQREKRAIKQNLKGPVELKQAQERLTGLEERAEQETRRLEGLQRRCEEVEPLAVTLGESARTLWTARSDGSREEVLAGEIDGLKSQIRELEGEIGELERGLGVLRARYERARERFEGARERVSELVGALREVPDTLSEWALSIAKRLGVPVSRPVRTLDELETSVGFGLASEANAMRGSARELENRSGSTAAKRSNRDDR